MNEEIKKELQATEVSRAKLGKRKRIITESTTQSAGNPASQDVNMRIILFQGSHTQIIDLRLFYMS